MSEPITFEPKSKLSSVTIWGLIIILVAAAADRLGIPLVDGSAEETVTILGEIVGVFVAAYGRLRKGDLQ